MYRRRFYVVFLKDICIFSSEPFVRLPCHGTLLVSTSFFKVNFVIRTIYTFDNANELDYNSGLIEIVTTIDDPTPINPFTSGALQTSGAIDVVDDVGLTSGYITNSGFVFVTSGDAFRSSGELVNFDFGTLRRLRSISIYQNPDNYAVDYRIIADQGPIVVVRAATNSGTITHALLRIVTGKQIGRAHV